MCCKCYVQHDDHVAAVTLVASPRTATSLCWRVRTSMFACLTSHTVCSHCAKTWSRAASGEQLKKQLLLAFLRCKSSFQLLFRIFIGFFC